MIRALPFVFLPLSAQAVTLELPANAALSAQETAPAQSYDMPVGPWTPDGLDTLTGTGDKTMQAWRVDAPGVTTLQLLTPLRAQLEQDGFEILFTCTDDICGGFDFRFASDVLPAPAMYVDLGDYRYIAAHRQSDGRSELVSLLASRSASAGFVQITQIGGQISAQTTAAAPVLRAPTAIEITGDLAADLETRGRFILSDLSFQTGSAQLGEGPFKTLQDLAEYLIANPSRTVALVGHTDATGSLEGNIALSKRRAGSVLERMVTTYNIPRRQLSAEGMGFLAPISTNLTDEGRTANRRVEVIVTSTQ